jgi:CheY-like chemotaxis protein
MTNTRVLHVDDEPDLREVVEISLGLDPGFETRSCGSGQEALTVVAEWPPDIILLDVMMPEMDGPATLARLRDGPQTADIPVVFMTARAQARELDSFRKLGAVGVIPKPFDPMTLAASVRAYIVPKSRRLAGLRKAFLQRTDHDAVTLLRHRSALLSETVSSAMPAEIANIAHRLAGSSGIFGFPEIGNMAAALDEVVMLGGSVEEIARALDGVLACIEANRLNSREQSHSRRNNA